MFGDRIMKLTNGYLYLCFVIELWITLVAIIALFFFEAIEAAAANRFGLQGRGRGGS